MFFLHVDEHASLILLQSLQQLPYFMDVDCSFILRRLERWRDKQIGWLVGSSHFITNAFRLQLRTVESLGCHQPETIDCNTMRYWLLSEPGWWTAQPLLALALAGPMEDLIPGSGLASLQAWQVRASGRNQQQRRRGYLGMGSVW